MPHPPVVDHPPSASVLPVNILETVGIYAVVPLLLYGLIALLSMVPGRAKKHPRYQPGASWDFPDQWWAGDYPIPAADPALVSAGTEGGARGTW